MVFRSPVTSMIPVVKALPYILPSVPPPMKATKKTSPPRPTRAKRHINMAGIGGRATSPSASGSRCAWKPGTARIANFHIHQLKVTPEMAELAAELRIEATKAGNATITIIQEPVAAVRRRLRQTRRTRRRDRISISHPAANRAARSCGIPPDMARRIAIASPPRFASAKRSSRRHRGSQDRPAFHRTAPRQRPMGQELYLRGERHSGVRQGRQRDSLRQLSQPGHARAAIARSCSRARCAHEHGARVGRRLSTSRTTSTTSATSSA